MEEQVEIQRPLATPTSNGGSFELGLRALILERSKQVYWIGLAVTVIAYVFHKLILGMQPELDSALAAWDRLIWAGHPLSFVVGLSLLYTWPSASVRALQKLALTVFAIDLAVSMIGAALFRPSDPLFIAAAIFLFVPAALIPWPVRYQLALGAVTVVSFLLGNVMVYQLVPNASAYWGELGGSMAYMNHLIEGTFGHAILAAIAAIASRTLYTLRKTAHKAKKLGNYVIRGEAGQGGMGQVFVAQHALMCRPTAVKVLKSDNNNPTALARFEREVRLSSTLTHPNTITVYDFGRTQNNEFFYAMEYLEGLDLQQLVERYGPVPAARTAFILAQVASSLAEAHSRGVVHRDVKPSNIFLTRRGGLYDFVKVLDFGLAKEIDEDSTSAVLTHSGVIFGTPLYISPETVYGPDTVDGRADIYNLGGVAYWMLTGRPPFSSKRSVEVMIDHVKTVPKRPSEISELDIPPELDAIVMKCLEKKPEDRFHTAEELEAALLSIDFKPNWNRKKAREWWALHGIVGEHPLDCECFAPESVIAEGDELTELALEHAP